MSQSRENLQTDGRMDEQTLFYKTFPAEDGGPATSLASDWWKYNKSYFKENAKIFSKNSTIQRGYYNFKTKIRLQNLYKKENFKPEIKPMIENLQDEIYQLENKQKVLNFVLTLETGGKKMPQNFLEST